MLRNEFFTSILLMTIAVISASVFTTLAEAQDLQSKLHGVWKVDFEKTKDVLKREKYSQKEIEEFSSRVKSVRLTFFKENRLVVSLPEDKRELAGKTKIQETDEKKKLIKILVTPEQPDQEDSPSEAIFSITFNQDDEIVVVAGDEPPLVLARDETDDGKNADGEEDENN